MNQNAISNLLAVVPDHGLAVIVGIPVGLIALCVIDCVVCCVARGNNHSHHEQKYILATPVNAPHHLNLNIRNMAIMRRKLNNWIWILDFLTKTINQ